jgi:hypothetical protein
VPAMRQALRGQTRAASPRQLPTNHDYAGGPNGSIREYQSDQPSSIVCSVLARVVPPAKTVEKGEEKTQASY